MEQIQPHLDTAHAYLSDVAESIGWDIFQWNAFVEGAAAIAFILCGANVAVAGSGKTDAGSCAAEYFSRAILSLSIISFFASFGDDNDVTKQGVAVALVLYHGNCNLQSLWRLISGNRTQLGPHGPNFLKFLSGMIVHGGLGYLTAMWVCDHHDKVLTIVQGLHKVYIEPYAGPLPILSEEL